MVERGLALLTKSILDRVRALAQLLEVAATRKRGFRRTEVPTSYDMDTKGRENSQGNMTMIAGIKIGDMGHAELEGIAITDLHNMGQAMGAIGSTMAATITVTAGNMSLRPATRLNVRVATAGDPRDGVGARDLLVTKIDIVSLRARLFLMLVIVGVTRDGDPCPARRRRVLGRDPAAAGTGLSRRWRDRPIPHCPRPRRSH